MILDNGSFLEYFSLAQRNALSPRESVIVDLRYGLTSGEPQTLEKVGLEIGVTRERIRQILSKSNKKLVAKGQKEIKIGKVNEPCAELLLYLENIIRPGDEGAVDRFVDYIEAELSYMPEKISFSLVASLVFRNKKVVEGIISTAKRISRQRKYAKRKVQKQKVLSEKFFDLLDYVIWPSLRTTQQEITDFHALERKRDVTCVGKGNAGNFQSNKLNRLVEYESELEYNFLQWLEQIDEILYYQEQPLEIPYNYEGKNHIYFPDILVILRDGKRIVVEIKPIFVMALHINLVKWAALKKFCNENGYGLLITDGKFAIQQIMYHNVNQNDSIAVFKHLAKSGELSWQEYRIIRDEFSPSRNDFVALVLKNKLIWRLSPFTLSVSRKQASC